jgi:hypothetical protein
MQYNLSHAFCQYTESKFVAIKCLVKWCKKGSSQKQTYSKIGNLSPRPWSLSHWFSGATKKAAEITPSPNQSSCAAQVVLQRGLILHMSKNRVVI